MQIQTPGSISFALALFLSAGHALGQDKPELAPMQEVPAAEEAVEDPDHITLAAFSEPVELTTLVELVARTLEINVSVKGDLNGSVVFNAPVKVHKNKLKDLLDALLEQHGYTFVYDPDSMFYSVMPSGEITILAGDERPTQRVFSTPNMRPSSLKPAIEAQLGIAVSAQGGVQSQRQIAYIDELGMIVATDTPRRLASLERMLQAFQQEFSKAEFIRIQLTNVSAPVARERALQLIGEIAQRSGSGQDAAQVQAMQMNAAGRAAGSIDNLGDRLTIDPQGNALIFRGLPAEVEQVQKLIQVIDVKNSLLPKQYFVGSAAQQVANLARQQGLGEVTTIAAQNTGNPYFNQFQQQGQVMPLQQQSSVGGPVMVVDESRGTIVYYGTVEQHEILTELIVALNIQSEKVVIRSYKLRYNKAEDVATVITGLITNQTPRGGGSLLPDGTSEPMQFGGFGGFGDPSAMSNMSRPNYTQPEDGQSDEDGLMLDNKAFVIADPKNNQVLVKAQVGQQDDFKKLIEKLDLRRPQVYVEAKIVAVTADDRLRLAFENQLINANGTGGVLNSNFGLGSLTGTTAQPQPLLAQKLVSGALTGFTAAVIKNDQVPIVMRALANETDSRIVASPQLLVDDNEEAEVTSVDSQPVPTRIVRDSGSSTGNDVVTSDREIEAGTTLKVTPQISDGGSLRLK
ncbi:MAG: secretin N-terminal domain-containing protein [Phycisphaerales bacterium]